MLKDPDGKGVNHCVTTGEDLWLLFLGFDDWIRGSRSIDLAVSKFSRENLFFKFRRARSRPLSRFRFFAQHLSFGGGGGCVDWSWIAPAVVRFSEIGGGCVSRNKLTRDTATSDF